MALQTPQEWVDYLNQKAGAETGLKLQSVEPDAYTNGDGKHVILPYIYTFNATLPAFESDGTTAVNENFKFLNKFRLPIKVTYSGTAKA